MAELLDTVLKTVGETKTETFFGRFSVLLLVNVIGHTLFYLAVNDELIEKPHISVVLGLVLFHIVHTLVMKYLLMNNMQRYAWFLLFLPALIYGAYRKYEDRRLRMEKIRFEAFKAQYEAQKKKEEPQDLLSQAPQSDFIMPDSKMGSTNHQVVMPQHGGGYAPQTGHYGGTNGSIQQYDTNQMMSAYGNATAPQYINSASEFEDIFSGY